MENLINEIIGCRHGKCGTCSHPLNDRALVSIREAQLDGSISKEDAFNYIERMIDCRGIDCSLYERVRNDG